MQRCFLTGCDYNTEWTLPWFVENYGIHNDVPLVIADFGMSNDMRKFAEKNSEHVITLAGNQANGWMLKPQAMNLSPAKETCWIDTDCQVLGDISSIFNYVVPNKLSMVEDRPWSKRRGEKWHNSGVVAFTGKPRIIMNWANNCETLNIRGDQEVLHWMMGGNLIKRMTYIEDLPHRYNVLRLDLLDGADVKDKLIVHWTGPKGKEKIKELMGR